jgi:hypothetical protein
MVQSDFRINALGERKKERKRLNPRKKQPEWLSGLPIESRLGSPWRDLGP